MVAIAVSFFMTLMSIPTVIVTHPASRLLDCNANVVRVAGRYGMVVK